MRLGRVRHHHGLRAPFQTVTTTTAVVDGAALGRARGCGRLEAVLWRVFRQQSLVESVGARVMGPDGERRRERRVAGSSYSPTH